MQSTIEIDGDEARASSRVMAWHWIHREDGDEYAHTDLLAIGGYQDRLRRSRRLADRRTARREFRNRRWQRKRTGTDEAGV